MKMQDNSAGWPEGWLVAAAAGVFAAVMARVVGDLSLFSTLVVGIFVFLVFGVLLGMFWGGTLPSGDHGQKHGHGHADGASSGHGHATAAPVAAPAQAAYADHGGVTDGHGGEPPVSEAPVAQSLMAALDAAPASDGAEPIGVASEPVIPEPTVAAPEPVAFVPAPLMAAEPGTAATDAAGSKPVGLSGPRGGVGDKLQTIEGIGPVLEKLCHELGIYHFDQIAGWGAAETAWMDGNLKGFKGRVTRDKWVRQASLIGEVGIAEFQRRAKINDY